MNAQRRGVVPANYSFTPAPTGLLERKCTCGNHTVAGGECSECSNTKRLGLQTKHKINEPGDIYEQEADRIADQVMATPAHHAVSGTALCIQRFSAQSNGHMQAASASVDQALASPGRPLEPALRQDMEQRFGYEFSQVRVHTDAKAAESVMAMDALAYTVGRDLVFGKGQYIPDSANGKRLLAHELVHVVQQGPSSAVVTLSRPAQSVIMRKETAEGGISSAEFLRESWLDINELGLVYKEGPLARGVPTCVTLLTAKCSLGCRRTRAFSFLSIIQSESGMLWQPPGKAAEASATLPTGS